MTRHQATDLQLLIVLPLHVYEVRNYLSVTDDKILGAEGLFQSLFIEPESKARF